MLFFHLHFFFTTPFFVVLHFSIHSSRSSIILLLSSSLSSYSLLCIPSYTPPFKLSPLFMDISSFLIHFHTSLSSPYMCIYHLVIHLIYSSFYSFYHLLSYSMLIYLFFPSYLKFIYISLASCRYVRVFSL